MAKQNIPIVDDEPDLLESFKIGLELKDYVVSIASTGKKALEEFRNERSILSSWISECQEWTGLKRWRK